MRGLLLAAVFAATLCSGAATAQNYPSRPVTHAGAASRPAASPTSSPACRSERMKTSLGQPVIVENVGGRRRHHRRHAAASCAGRRLHADRRPVDVACRRRRDVFDAVRLPQGLRAGLAALDRAALDHRQQGPAAEGSEGADRLAQGQSRPAARPAPPASAAASTCAWSISRTRPAPNSRWCRIAARRRSCRTCLAGQIDLSCPEAGQTLPQYRAGTIKAYAVLQKKRWFAAPDVPTIDEAGVPGLHFPFWHGLWTRQGHAEGRGRQAQRRGRRRAGRPGGAPEARRSRP